jgi:hypothetical protein
MFSAIFGGGARGTTVALDEPFLLNRIDATLPNRVDAALIGAFAVIAVYFLVYPVWRSQFLIEIWFTEGWNAYFQDAAASGAQLYPASDALIVNNYPPLSFYVIGLLGKGLGDDLFVGRALSLVSLVAVSVEIFSCVRTLCGGTFGPAIGALWYAAIMSHNFTSYVGANDPQLAGEAIMGGGLAWLLIRDKAGRSVYTPLLVMVVAGFWKHNMIAMPIAAIAWLFIRHGSKAWGPVLASSAATAAGLGFCGLIFGADFFQNLLVAREYSSDHVVGNIGHLQWSALAALIWFSWVLSNRTPGAIFTSIHVPIALVSCLIQWLGDKVFGNAEFDLIIALGMAVGITCESLRFSPFARRVGISRSRTIIVALLALRLVATDRQETMLLAFDPQFRSKIAADERSLRKEAVDVAKIEGSVYCEVKVVCRRAGKPFVVDDFKVEEMVATKHTTEAGIEEMLALHGITRFKSDPASMGAVDTSLSHALIRYWNLK